VLHRAYGLSGAKLQVVPAGVDLSRFWPAPARNGRPPTILFVGRLQPLKGPDVATATLAEVRRTVPDARLRIVGGASGTGIGTSGPAELRQLAHDLGVAEAVSFEPAVSQEELAGIYRQADVLVAPSRSETFGLVALEAQASGLPVVAADVPGLQVVVGGGGTLVSGHDPAAHAAAVVRFLTDPAHASAAATAGVALAARATWDRSVERLLGVYGSVLDERRATAEAATGDRLAVDEVAV
jgi:D-inositol-3-phosphate glycosyltransferase